MKNLFKYIFVAAALVISSAAASAQPQDGNKYSDAEKAAIKVSKKVEGPAKDGSFTLTLDTFIEGEQDSRQSVTMPKPADIVLVLDMSGSMNAPMSGTPKQTSDNKATIYSNWRQEKKHYYIHTSGTTYYKIVDITVSGNTYTAKYYNSGWSTTTINNDGSNVYEGNESRLDALKTSTKEFIDIIAASTTPTLRNKISIVKFAGSSNSNARSTNNIGFDTYGDFQRTQKVTPHLLATSDSLKWAVNQLVASGATHTKEGLQHAKSILDAVTRDSKKSVILFTDGLTNSSEEDVYAITNALKLGTNAANKNVAADKGIAKIYTIGAFASEAEAGDFLKFNSSNYAGDVKISGGKYSGTRVHDMVKVKDEAGHETQVEVNYSIVASSTTALRNAFAQFAEYGRPEEDGGAGIALVTNTVTVKDILTSHFVLPSGAADGAKDVTVSVIPVKTPARTEPFGAYTPEWNYAAAVKNPDGVTVTISSAKDQETNEDTSSIDVQGFDFSAHWVGLERTFVGEKETAQRIHEAGQMLRIEIKIIPNPNDVGGQVKTNDDNSGFYFDGETAPLQNYKSPGYVFVPMDMEIILNGLDADESALFKVYRYNKDAKGNDTDKEEEPIVIVALTGESSATTVSKLPIMDIRESKDKDGTITTNYYPFTYVVECDSNWSWKYEITPSATTDEGAKHALVKRESGEKYDSINTFVFNAVKTEKGRLPVNKDDKGGTAKYIYDESNVNNVFKRVTN